MKAGVIGSSSQQRSLPFDAQRNVNLFVVSDPQGSEQASLYSRPGLQLFGTVGVGPGRGGFSATNGRTFTVSGSIVYEIMADGSGVSRGSLDQSQGNLTMDENGFQLAICDGLSLYIFTYATNTFQKVINVNLPSAASVTFIDGYFVTNRVSSGIFQISGLYDGNTWAALDFATAESSPDSLLRVLNVLGQLWLFGAKTTEIWYNNGSVAFPFSRISGGKMETGIQAPFSAIAVDNSAFWVGRDGNGAGIVFRADGFTPKRISTEAIELRIQTAPTPSTLKSYTYQENGHPFWILTGGGMETALVYDISTQLWSEWAYLNDDGRYELPRGIQTIYAFNKQIVVDRDNGNLYIQSLDYYSDNGREIPRDRIFTHIINENQRQLYSNITVGFETGVGIQYGQGNDPKCMLSLSSDGGRTWFGNYVKTIGKAGQYRSRVTFQRLGQARERTFRIRLTDPVRCAITGAYFNV